MKEQSICEKYYIQSTLKPRPRVKYILGVPANSNQSAQNTLLANVI